MLALNLGSLTQSLVAKYQVVARQNRLRQKDLRCHCFVLINERHQFSTVWFINVKHCWARGVVGLHKAVY